MASLHWSLSPPSILRPPERTRAWPTSSRRLSIPSPPLLSPVEPPSKSFIMNRPSLRIPHIHAVHGSIPSSNRLLIGLLPSWLAVDVASSGAQREAAVIWLKTRDSEPDE